MKLGELKKSLNRFSGDMDDCEIIFTFQTESNEPNYENLAFVAYAEIGEQTCVVFGSTSAAIERIKKGTLHYLDGSKPTDSGFELNGGE